MFLIKNDEVIVVPCRSYDRDELASAYQTIFEHFDNQKLKGKSIFLKPNILMGVKPEKASVTHPEIVFPVAKYLKNLNCDVKCGDSPNFMTNSKIIDGIYKTAGISSIIEEAGCRMDNSSKGTKVKGGKYLPEFKMLTNILISDVVINIAKAKTHSFTGYTGAVKNLFGVIPGPIKGEMHLNNPDGRAFTNVLIDICETVNADLHIVDAVIGMEGPGPSSGTPKRLGAIVAGTNPYAVDEVVIELMGIDKDNVEQVNLARERSLTKPVNQIKIIGTDLETIKEHYVPFKDAVVRVNAFWKVLRSIIPNEWFMKMKPKPYVQDNCIACGVCAEACPPSAIKIKDIAEINYKKCIKCYCCQELCPAKAILIGKKDENN